jgi:hypothetical protein
MQPVKQAIFGHWQVPRLSMWRCQQGRFLVASKGDFYTAPGNKVRYCKSAIVVCPHVGLATSHPFGAPHQINSFTNRLKVLLFRPVSVIIAASKN